LATIDPGEDPYGDGKPKAFFNNGSEGMLNDFTATGSIEAPQCF